MQIIALLLIGPKISGYSYSPIELISGIKKKINEIYYYSHKNLFILI